jgi:HK97 gp10 family phage protein
MRITGMEETRKALDNLDREVQKKILRKGLRKGCKVMLRIAKADAPFKTGKLKRNIKIRSGGVKYGKLRMTVGIGNKDYTGEAFYAAFLLYGWRVGSRKLGDARRQVPPNNFLRRAYESAGEQAVTTTLESWKELIEQEASK